MEKKKYEPFDMSKLKRYPIAERKNLVSVDAFGGLVGPEESVEEFIDSLGDFLGARALKSLAKVIATAYINGKHVAFAIGGHNIKVGMGPVYIDLIERDIVTAIAMHGATAIHDYEISLIGETSEDVAKSLADGSFGMAAETGDFFARAAKLGADEGIGFGRASGDLILKEGNKFAGKSILAACARKDIPCTVHVAFGTDIVHMHGVIDPADLGAATDIDFRILCTLATALDGGVWVNAGSAVIMPEVFLKAVNVAQNELGRPIDLTTANLDMLRHYRTSTNVLGRPAKTSYEINGHHEIMIPLLRCAILAALKKE